MDLIRWDLKQLKHIRMLLNNKSIALLERNKFTEYLHLLNLDILNGLRLNGGHYGLIVMKNTFRGDFLHLH